MPDEMEQVEDNQEQVEESEEQAEAEVTEDKKAEVTDEKDTEVSEEEEKPDPEEQFQSRLSTEYAKWQSKTLNPVIKERDELKRKLAESSDETDLKVLRLHDEQELGEDEAAKYDTVRKRTIDRVREYERSRDEVTANKEKLELVLEMQKTLNTDDIESLAIKLSDINRINTATMDIVRLYSPEVSEEMDKAIKRLNSTSSPEHYKDVLNNIKTSYKGKRPKQNYERGGQSPGTGELNDKEFTEQYGSGLLKDTPENKKRAAKLAGYSLPQKR